MLGTIPEHRLRAGRPAVGLRLQRGLGRRPASVGGRRLLVRGGRVRRAGPSGRQPTRRACSSTGCSPRSSRRRRRRRRARHARPDGAGPPQVAVQEYGAGWVTSQQQQSHNLFAIGAREQRRPGCGETAEQLCRSKATADAVPADGRHDLDADRLAAGSGRGRSARDPRPLCPERLDPRPRGGRLLAGLGATDAGEGLFAGGDLAGDAAIAWVAGKPAARRGSSPDSCSSPRAAFERRSQRSVRDHGQAAAEVDAASERGERRTTSSRSTASRSPTRLRPSTASPVALTQGRHAWQVTAVNLAGLTSSSSARDRVRRLARPGVIAQDHRQPARRGGRPGTGSRPATLLAASPARPTRASKSVRSKLGRRRQARRSSAAHRTSTPSAGPTRVTVTVTDRAGNSTVRSPRRSRSAAASPKRRQGAQALTRARRGLSARRNCWAAGRGSVSATTRQTPDPAERLGLRQPRIDGRRPAVGRVVGADEVDARCRHHGPHALERHVQLPGQRRLDRVVDGREADLAGVDGVVTADRGDRPGSAGRAS